MKKIMFSREYGLEQSVIERIKTKTRRIANLPMIEGIDQIEYAELGTDSKGNVVAAMMGYLNTEPYRICTLMPQYQIGETLAVAQRYMDIKPRHELIMKWKGTVAELCESAGFTNKMFVSAELMPHHVQITDIGMEQLQDITDEDCLKEGIMEGEFMNTWDRFYYDHWGDVPNHITFKTPRKAFASLIDKTTRTGTWQRNPWTWVYSLKLID